MQFECVQCPLLGITEIASFLELGLSIKAVENVHDENMAVDGELDEQDVPYPASFLSVKNLELFVSACCVCVRHDLAHVNWYSDISDVGSTAVCEVVARTICTEGFQRPWVVSLYRW